MNNLINSDTLGNQTKKSVKATNVASFISICEQLKSLIKQHTESEEAFVSKTEKEIEQLQKKIEKEISKLQRDDTFGFEDDSIFLLSKEEYEQYKDQIPQINCWWWLRSPGYFSCNVAGVNSDGSISNYGDCVHHNNNAVHPALKLKSIDPLYYNKTRDGRGVIYCGTTWECIDEEKEYYIAEMPIAFRRFDGKSNDYALSEIRKFLYNWQKGREVK